MAHGWIDYAVNTALGLLVIALCGLVKRFVDRVDELQKAKEQHAREIRDTRQAISRIEGKLDLEPFPYTSE